MPAPTDKQLPYLSVTLRKELPERDVPAMVEIIEHLSGVEEVAVARGQKLVRRLRELENANERLRDRVAELEALTDSEQTTVVPTKGWPAPAELSRMNKPDLVNMVLRLQRKVQALNKRATTAEQAASRRKR